jgi:hypothetical protein
MQLSWTPRAAAHWQRAAQLKRLFSKLTESVEKDGRCNNYGLAQKFAERGIYGKDVRFQTNTLFVDGKILLENHFPAPRFVPHDSRVTRRTSRRYSDNVLNFWCRWTELMTSTRAL